MSTGGINLDSENEPDQARSSQRMARLKHPRAVRWMHWINFPLLTIMIWSGLRIYTANDVYRIGYGDTTLFGFFPDAIIEPLQLDRKLAKGMAFHFTFAWFFVINGLLYTLYNLFTGEWRHVFPDRYALRNVGRSVLHDLHLSDTKPVQGRYNPAQQFAYAGVIVLGALATLSGLAIYKPSQLSFLTTILGGYEFARFIHFWVTMLFLAFFVVHVLQVLRAGWPNFWSMVTGYELDPQSDNETEEVAEVTADV